MPKPIPLKAAADFVDAVEICNALHGADQPFTIKLLHRPAHSRHVTQATFKHATLAEHAATFSRWQDEGIEPFVMVGQTTAGGIGRDNVNGTWGLAVDLDHDIDLSDWVNSLIKPSFAIRTSCGRYHLCWILLDALSNVEAKRFLMAMAHRLGGDPCFAHSAQAVRR